MLYPEDRAWMGGGLCYTLENSDSEKDLEVTTNKQLNMNTQCNVAKMANAIPGGINRR